MIEAHVKAHASSLVVVGSRADPAAMGLGSTAAKVVRSAACPVLVVRMPAAAPYDKVLTAVDVSEGSTHAAAFAVALFPIAHHHLLYLLDPGLDRALWMGGITAEHARAQRDSMHAHAARELQQLARALAREATHPVTVDVVEDVPARAIVAAAGSMPADCVVVGHHGPGAHAERLLGNLAQHVVYQTTRDVLVVPAVPG
ncbi:MAG: universal stress protein [Burkholderiales bacterium]|nr:universal stress protein [Burkholderiales bacterium]